MKRIIIHDVRSKNLPTAKFPELVSRIVVDRQYPGADAGYLIRRCPGASIRQTTWKRGNHE